MPSQKHRDKISVSEVFGPTVQGEGDVVGLPTVFVRTGGCDFLCVWCLGSNTSIRLASGGTKKMKDIEEGDILIGYNEATGELEETTVVAKAERKEEFEKVYRIEVTNSSNSKGKKTVCSGDHQFYVKGKGWIFAADINEGDVILTGHDYALESWVISNNNPMFDKVTQKKVSASLKETWKDPELRDRQRAIQMRPQTRHIHRLNKLGDKTPMKNPAIAAKSIRNRTYTMSNYERRVQRLVDYYKLPYANCDMKIRIQDKNSVQSNARYPDFHIPGTNKVVEVYDPTFRSIGNTVNREESGYANDRVAFYKRNGYDCLPLVVKPGVANKDIVKQLSEFAMNGSTVKSVKLLNKKARGAMYKSINEDGTLTLYDIKCEPVPTFFANHLLTHNCDSLHAVLPEHAKSWNKLTFDELEGEIEACANGRPLPVTLSGGNPALQPFGPLIKKMKPKGYTFAMETQGTIVQDWFEDLDWLILSPKPPSSGMVNDWNSVKQCIDAAGVQTSVSIKIVVMNDEDFEFVESVYREFRNEIENEKLTFFLSVGNPNPPHESTDPERTYGSNVFDQAEIVKQTEKILSWVLLQDFWVRTPRIIPQMHTLLWGNQKGV